MALPTVMNGTARRRLQEGIQAKVSPWAALDSPFLESRGAAERRRIFSLAEQAAGVLDSWAARFPIIRRVRVRPLALSVAAAAPFADVEAIISTARLSLWVFTLDDVFDEEQMPETELMNCAVRYRAIAHGLPIVPLNDSLASALLEVRKDLARYPLYASLGGEWAGALCGTIDGMVHELDWRRGYRNGRGVELPSYDDYVATGLYSIGGPPHVWAALITTDDPSTPQHLDYLRPMERIACTCIRLANDLQSHHKEIAEDNVNSLVILGRALQREGLPAEEATRRAESRVRADIAQGLESLARLQKAARTRTGRPEAAIADIARFVCEFYTRHDYHTFALSAHGDPESGPSPRPSPKGRGSFKTFALSTRSHSDLQPSFRGSALWPVRGSAEGSGSSDGKEGS